MTISTVFFCVLAILPAWSFRISPVPQRFIGKQQRVGRHTILRASLIEVEIPKPMGIVFEENDSGGGLYVFELVEGNAAKSAVIEAGDNLVAVEGSSVVGLSFDAAMDKLMAAPPVAALTFFRGDLSDMAPPTAAASGGTAAAPSSSSTTAELTVLAEGSPEVKITTQAGTILRNVLLENGVSLYTLWGAASNCNGAGQCGTCAVDIISSDPGSLGERTPTEDKKLRSKAPSTRLACQCLVNGGAVTLKTKP